MADSGWYTALYEENCKEVMKLLEDDPILLTKGWEGDPSRTVGGHRLNYWEDCTEGPWMGRTALHVGARRGCTALLDRVLALCRHGVGQIAGAGVSVSLENLLLAKDGEYKLDAIGMAAVNGNVDVLTILLSAGLGCDTIVKRYDIEDLRTYSKWEETREERERNSNATSEHRVKLAAITKEVIETFPGTPVFRIGILDGYEKHRDFNFLPRDIYLFHFLQTNLAVGKALPHRDEIATISKEVQAAIRKAVSQSQSPLELKRFLWELQDGQGRPPLHVAVDEDEDTLHRGVLELDGWFTEGDKKTFTEGDKKTFEKIVNALDGGGRTAMHRAVALGRTSAFSEVIKRGTLNPGEEVLQLAHVDAMSISQPSTWDSLGYRCGFYLDLNKLSKKNGFQGNEIPEGEPNFHKTTLLETTIIHKRREFLTEHTELDDDETVNATIKNFIGLRKYWVDKLLHEPFYMRGSEPMSESLLKFQEPKHAVKFDCLELAVLAGDTLTLEGLLQYVRAGDSFQKRLGLDVNFIRSCKLLPGKELFNFFGFLGGEKERRHRKKHPFTALHLAAATGKYDMLKLLSDIGRCDPYVKDYNGDTTLHHATQGRVFEFHPRLFDYVNCQQILSTQKDREKIENDLQERKQLVNVDSIVDREGCIDLLLQLGCTIYEINNDKQGPYPGIQMDAKFKSWWLEKKTKESEAVQRILAVAANAISVTGTLVATASYVGPLQPPLGYADDPSQLRLQDVWVKVFIVCDTMSFYLAVTAVILSLIPSLPMSQQSIIDEVQSTQRMVALATRVLFPSIIFVIIVFASSTIAVIQTNRTAWNHGGLTIGTACVGGSFCLGAIGLFFIRMSRSRFHRSRWIKFLYERII